MDGSHTGLAIVAGIFMVPLALLFIFFVVACAWHPIADLLRRSAEARTMAAQHRRLFAVEDAKRKAREQWEAEHPEEMAQMIREHRARMDFLSGGGGACMPDPRQRAEPDWRRAVALPPSTAKPMPLWPPGMDPRRKPKAKATDGVPTAEDLRKQFRLPAKRDRLLR